MNKTHDFGDGHPIRIERTLIHALVDQAPGCLLATHGRDAARIYDADSYLQGYMSAHGDDHYSDHVWAVFTVYTADLPYLPQRHPLYGTPTSAVIAPIPCDEDGNIEPGAACDWERALYLLEFETIQRRACDTGPLDLDGGIPIDVFGSLLDRLEWLVGLNPLPETLRALSDAVSNYQQRAEVSSIADAWQYGWASKQLRIIAAELDSRLP